MILGGLDITTGTQTINQPIENSPTKRKINPIDPTFVLQLILTEVEKVNI